MSGGGAESGTVTIRTMVGEARSMYPRDKSGACSSGSGGGDSERKIGRRRSGRVG